jgi:hypothetical protein
MISANNWLERRIETILDESFRLIMRPCHCSSSVLALFADDALRQFCLICWPLLSREVQEAANVPASFFCQVKWPLM